MVVVDEADTGRCERDTDVNETDISVKHDFDLAVKSHLKQEVFHLPGSYRVSYRGETAHLEFEKFPNFRKAVFRFIGPLKSEANDSLMYITIENGRRIEKYMSGRTEYYPSAFNIERLTDGDC